MIKNLNPAFAIILILLTTNLSAELYYNLEVYYDKGELTIKRVSVDFSNFEKKNNLNDFFEDYSVISTDGRDNEVERKGFNLINGYFYDEINESGDIVDGGFKEMENFSFKVYIPYNENAKEIVIYDSSGKEAARKDVSEYSSKEDYERAVTEKSSEKRSDAKARNIILWIIGILVLIALIGLIVKLKRE